MSCVGSGGEGLKRLASSSEKSKTENGFLPNEGKATLWCRFPGDRGGDGLRSELHLLSDPRGEQSAGFISGHEDQSLFKLFVTSIKGAGDTSISGSLTSSLRMSERTEFLEMTLSMSISSSSLIVERVHTAVAIGLGSLGLLLQGRRWPGSISRTAVSSTSALDCILANSLLEHRVVPQFKKDV